MFLVDFPYISEFFKKTVKENGIPIVDTPAARALDLLAGTHFLSEDEAVRKVKENGNLALYSTSENAIAWISKHLEFSSIPTTINLFKDKFKFRKLIQELYPDFFFKGVKFSELSTVRIQDFQLPFIIKPAIGFFSLGVYKVSTYQEWEPTLKKIISEVDHYKKLYPASVLDTNDFIIEQCLEGEEYAVDAYYDADGNPVILNILLHTFASETDVSDRVYTTSKEIIKSNLKEFTQFAAEIGKLAEIKNFPVHIELRRNKGKIFPIEVNPMRFGGWCTTADMAYHAFGFNPYLYYYHQKKPNWDDLLNGKEDKLYSIIVLDNSTGISVDKIQSFDFDKLLAMFENPLELRKIDYCKFQVFGFLFTETSNNNFKELERILSSDLSEFVSTC